MANDRMKLVCERPGGQGGGKGDAASASETGAAAAAGRVADERALGEAVSTSVRDITKLRVDAVEWVDAGSLPNDGKVIDDRRKYD